jgi:hypothetical protein
MKVPVLIFLISGIAASQLEPVASRGIQRAVKYASQNDHVQALSSQLADAQLDMMRVLRSAHDSVETLERHEAGLKYAIRAEQIRLAEQAQCRQGSKIRC